MVSIKFDYENYIDEDILDYIFDVYPLFVNNYQKVIQSLAIHKISIPYLNKILRKNMISLTLDTLQMCINKFDSDTKYDVCEFISFVETCLEISKWENKNSLNGALEIVFTVCFDDSTIWKTIVELFIAHGYDPSKHDINIRDFLHQPGLLEYLVEIMDPNRLATTLISSKTKIFYERISEDEVYDFMIKAFKIFVVNGVDMNSLLSSSPI